MKRFKQLNILLILALLISSLVVSVPGAVSAQVSPFKDVSNTHWGLQHIMKMELRKIVTGYPDGTFLPDRHVTQLEAVTMAVRAMGLESQASTVNTSNLGQFNLPTNWNAAGYVAIALREGVIDVDNFHPNNNASRSWVAQMIIRMIGAEGELNTAPATSFEDNALIPTWARQFVALAVQKDIITGINTAGGKVEFQPNNPVTRAQLATMISRSDKYMEDVVGQLPKASIQSITNSQLIVNQGNGQQTSHLIASSVVAFNNQAQVNLTSLKQGDVIRFGKNEAGYIIFIEKLNEEDTFSFTQVSGTIEQHFKDNRLLTIKDATGKLHVYNYEANTPLRSSTGTTITRSAADLVLGETVTLVIDQNNKLNSIQVTSSVTAGGLTGKIFSIDLTRGIINLEVNSQYTAHTFDNNVQVEYEGIRFATVRDLKAGDQVELVSTDNKITLIKVIKPFNQETVTGKVVVTSTANNVLTVRSSDGRIRAHELANNAEITIQGMSSPSLADIRTDDDVTLTIEENIITKIVVNNRLYSDQLSGVIKSLDTVNRLITIENNNKELRTYIINDNVQLNFGISRPVLRDLEIGMRVKLNLTDNKVATITLDNTLEGTVVKVDTRDNLITVKTAGNTNTTYSVISGASVNIINLSLPRLVDVKQDDQVVLIFDGDEVIGIDVKRTLLREVSGVDVTRDRIVVKDGSSTRNYTFLDYTTLSIPNFNNPRFSDIKSGDAVQLSFTGYNLTAVTVVPPEYGFVKSVEGFRNQILITTINNIEKRIEINEALRIYNSRGNTVTFSNLKTNDYIKLVTLDNMTTMTVSEAIQATVTTLNLNDGRIFVANSNGVFFNYTLSPEVRIWKGTSTLSINDVKANQNVTLYLLNNQVVGISIQ